MTDQQQQPEQEEKVELLKGYEVGVDKDGRHQIHLLGTTTLAEGLAFHDVAARLFDQQMSHLHPSFELQLLVKIQEQQNSIAQLLDSLCTMILQTRRQDIESNDQEEEQVATQEEEPTSE